MLSFGMRRRVALVKTDVSEKPIATNITVTRIGEVERIRGLAVAFHPDDGSDMYL
jgi:hypothetical protein